MEFSELIEARYSVRAYKTDAIEEEKLQRILDAANLAPTASNAQATTVSSYDESSPLQPV